VCSCSQDTIHLIYGNATVHIWVGDLRDLGMAMQTIAEGLDPKSSQNGSDTKKNGLLQ